MLRNIVHSRPDLYLDEIASKLESKSRIYVSPKTIYSAIKDRLYMTMKQMGKMAKDHDDDLRQCFLDKLSSVTDNPMQFIWIDESAKDASSSRRQRRWYQNRLTRKARMRQNIHASSFRSSRRSEFDSWKNHQYTFIAALDMNGFVLEG